MSRIRSADTVPEGRMLLLVREALGYRWRIDRNAGYLPGKPDVVVPSLHLCIFVDGCFFHGCPRHYRVPATRPEYWAPKVARNQARDRRHARVLRRNGWSVWRFWEHDLKASRLDETAADLERRIARRRSAIRAGANRAGGPLRGVD